MCKLFIFGFKTYLTRGKKTIPIHFLLFSLSFAPSRPVSLALPPMPESLWKPTRIYDDAHKHIHQMIQFILFSLCAKKVRKKAKQTHHTELNPQTIIPFLCLLLLLLLLVG